MASSKEDCNWRFPCKLETETATNRCHCPGSWKPDDKPQATADLRGGGSGQAGLQWPCPLRCGVQDARFAGRRHTGVAAARESHFDR